MTRIEFIPGNDGPEVRGVLDLLLEQGSVASTLVHRIPDRSRPVICPGWLAFWVERERARQVAEDAACERPSLPVPEP